MEARNRENELRLVRLANAEMRAKQDLDVAKMRHLEARLRCLEEAVAGGSAAAAAGGNGGGGDGLFLASGSVALSSPTATPSSTSSPSVAAGAPNANLLV